MSRAIVVTIIVLLLIGGAVLLFRRSEPTKTAALTAESIALMGYHPDGSTAWSLQAETGTLDRESGELESINLTFYRDAIPHIVVVGDHLSQDPSGNSMTGGIRVQQAGSLSMETDAVFWDEHNRMLESGPVAIEMETTSIDAGGFRHNLETDVTTLTHGVEAHVTQESKTYTITSDTAEVISDRLLLIGDVTIQESSGGDQYRCQQLESDFAGATILLSGGVSGSWNNSDFSAGMVQLDHAGVRMKGNVTINLELKQQDAPHDA